MVEVRPARTREEIDAAMALRLVVFVHEQGVPVAEELDGLDDTALHLVAVGDDGEVVGTLRLVSEDDALRLGRLAVAGTARRRGVARALLAEAERIGRRRGATRIVLSAQTHAVALYEHAGYIACGPTFLDAGIEHRPMELSLA